MIFYCLFSVVALGFFSTASSSNVENRMNALLQRKGSAKFSLKTYEALRDSGAAFSSRHLKTYSSCDDPMGFLNALFKRGYVPSSADLVENVEDETLFNTLYNYTPLQAQRDALSLIIKGVYRQNYDLRFYTERCPDLGAKAGKLGLSLPQYGIYFVDLIQMKPDSITVDFLKFLHNNGVTFNSTAFNRENFFAQTILEDRYDLADFMADHGAKFSRQGASYMLNSSNRAKLQKFVRRRAWRVLKDMLPGLVDLNSTLQELPHEITQHHIAKMLVDSVEADLFPK